MHQKTATIALLSLSLAAVAPTCALAQAEVAGAIAGALAAQQMNSDAESRRLASLVESAPPYELHGLCAQVKAHLTSYALQSGANLRLEETYRKSCREAAAR